MLIQFNAKVIEFHSMEIKHQKEHWGQYPDYTDYWVHILYINDEPAMRAEDIKPIVEKFNEIIKALSEKQPLYIWTSIRDDYCEYIKGAYPPMR